MQYVTTEMHRSSYRTIDSRSDETCCTVQIRIFAHGLSRAECNPGAWEICIQHQMNAHAPNPSLNGDMFETQEAGACDVWKWIEILESPSEIARKG